MCVGPCTHPTFVQVMCMSWPPHAPIPGCFFCGSAQSPERPVLPETWMCSTARLEVGAGGKHRHVSGQKRRQADMILPSDLKPPSPISMLLGARWKSKMSKVLCTMARGGKSILRRCLAPGSVLKFGGGVGVASGEDYICLW